MTIEERIKIEEKAVEDMYFKEETLDGLPGYMVTKEDYEECRKSVNEHQELINWLKELKAQRNNLTNQSLSDALVHSENENERLYNRVNELSKELQAHREAWEKVTGIINKWKDSVGGVVVAKDAFSDILDLITDFRPKEGESNDSSNN